MCFLLIIGNSLLSVLASHCNWWLFNQSVWWCLAVRAYLFIYIPNAAPPPPSSLLTETLPLPFSS
jgi:hypothetical protein